MRTLLIPRSIEKRVRFIASFGMAVVVYSCSTPAETQIAKTPPQELRDAFVVAIAGSHEGGHHLEPIARFTGASWVNTWPEPADGGARRGALPAPPLAELPESWLGRPIPLEWTVWSSTGERQRAHVNGTRRGDQCVALIQLTLDPGESPGTGPLEGRVAVDTDQRVEGFLPVTNADPAWETLSALVQATYESHLGLAFDNHEYLNRLISQDALRSLPLGIEFLVRSASSTMPALYYFDAAKRFTPTRRPARGVAVSGWIREGTDGKLVAFEVQPRGIGGEGGPIPSEVPLASFHLMERHFVLVDVRGYEASAARIVEVTPERIAPVLEAHRGGC